jgi:hypothetical protein
VPGVFERQAVQDLAVRPHDGKRVVDADGSRVIVEELAEVGLAQPAVDAQAHLDAYGFRDRRRPALARREIDLAVAALADQGLGAVPQQCFRARHDLPGRQQVSDAARNPVNRSGAAGCG